MRPYLSLWIKYHWKIVRLLPGGLHLWYWADSRVDGWHKRMGRT